jgi:hypothetical protein
MGTLKRYTSGLDHSSFLHNAPGIESLHKSVPESELTQENMLVPVQNLVAIKDSFAIVHVSGHQVCSQTLTVNTQYKVTEGDEIMVEKLEAPVLSQILLDKVLLVGTK